jgi:hypothetical protein
VVVRFGFTTNLRTRHAGQIDRHHKTFGARGTGRARDGVRIWRLDDGAELAHLAIGTTYAALFHPSGRSLTTSGDLGLHRWPIRDGESSPRVRRIGPPELIHWPESSWMSAADATPDGRTLFAAHRVDAG